MDVKITKQEAKNIISLFFDQEWPQVDVESLEITRVTEGHSNTVHIVRRNSNEAKFEPHAVIVRHYGANYVDWGSNVLKNSETEEIIVFKEMSDRGWGPKLFGVFVGGRIEEFIEGSTLSPSDSKNLLLMEQIAKGFARFHTLEPPFNQSKLQLWRDSSSCVTPDDQKKQLMIEFQEEKKSGSLEMLKPLLDWDREAERKWLLATFQSQKFSRSFMHTDPNFLNFISRKQQKEYHHHEDDVDDEKSSTVVMFDYELSMYGYRGIDLGGHFISRTFDLRENGDGLSCYPSERERRQFIAAYVQEHRILGGRDELDVDDLLVEADYGSMFMILIWMDVIFRGNLISNQRKFLTICHHFYLHYVNTKERLQKLRQTA